MALILKTDQETKAPIQTDEGKFVYVDDKDNSEIPLDPAAMYDKIAELGVENQKHRTRFQTAEGSLVIFKDIDDLPAYKEKADAALVTVENFNDKDWMKADKVDKLKSDITLAFEGQLRDKDTAITDLTTMHGEALSGKDQQIRKLMVSSQFSTSPFFTAQGDTKAKTTLPPDIGEATFGSHFRVEEINGAPTLRAYRGDDLVMSKLNPGDPAGFNEALALIIDAYPNRDSILSASGPGTGGKGGKGDGAQGDETLADLKKQHGEALTAGRTQDAISLKHRIFELEQNARQ